jgi:hypothetical protein
MLVMNKLPNFAISDYKKLLTALKLRVYVFFPVSKLREKTNSLTAYLRHDIDFFLDGWEDIPNLEADMRIRATYFVPLTQRFNVFEKKNRHKLKVLTELGHEIGLHYDLSTYPAERKRAREYLEFEIAVLEELIGGKIKTICMHRPYKRDDDPFRELDEYVHPHDPRYQEDLLYISDSCRAWRDENLLTCFGPNPPRRLLLNTHPELWLDGTIVDRITYLDEVLIENGTRQHREYVNKCVRQVWLNHPAPRLHDKRERQHLSSALTPVSAADLPGGKR